MPIVDHKAAPEVPWRPKHRKWDITTPGDGTTGSSLSYFVVGPGAGRRFTPTRATSLW